jgi:nitroreductase
MPHVLDVDLSRFRTPDHEIEDLFVRRWSPRAMSGESIEHEQVMRLLEAARWAPSSYNEQPWRFLYAKRDTPHWQTFFDLLVEGNKAWCKGAAVLFVIVTKKTFTRNGKDNPVCVFDAGSAWQTLALQGAAMGLVVHGMAGFDAEKAKRELDVPDDFHVCAMVAVGKPGQADDLPENLREIEKPSNRKPVAEISMEGGFKS